MGRKNIDITVAAIACAVFVVIVGINLLQKERPTFSESENRDLSKMPEFSIASLLDGSYFKNIDSFVSDTFCGRENMVNASKKMGLMFGYAKKGGFIFIGGPEQSEESEESEDESWKQQLNSQSSESSEETQNSESSSEGSQNSESSQESEASQKSEASEESQNSESSQEADYKITLDRASAKIIIGNSVNITADFSDGQKREITWKSSNEKVAGVEKTAAGVKVSGIAEGKATVTATDENGKSVTVSIEVAKPEVNGGGEQEADFFSNGLFIYGDAVYVQGSYSAKRSQDFAQILSLYKQYFPSSRIDAVIAPVSSVIIDDPNVTKNIVNQKNALQKLGEFITDDINYVNPHDALFERRNEYIYFKSDHHWTARGAYYAYQQFASSVGFVPTPLEDFEQITNAKSFSGSMYKYTKDERVKNITDVVEGFLPTKSNTMTIYYADGTDRTFNSCILNKYIKGYVAFIGGDNPYTVITVPDNPQDTVALVLKDSFGDAFVPFLCEHYGKIIVVDPRYADFNIREMFADGDLTDIIFAINIQAANSSSWKNYFLELVGAK